MTDYNKLQQYQDTQKMYLEDYLLVKGVLINYVLNVPQVARVTDKQVHHFFEYQKATENINIENSLLTDADKETEHQRLDPFYQAKEQLFLKALEMSDRVDVIKQ